MDILSSFNEEEETIQFCESNIAFIVDNSSFGKGTLYVAESKLFWKNDTNNQIVSVDYKSMCVFGTCTDLTVHEKPCMEIIVDFTYKPSGGNINENGHNLNGENNDPLSNEEDNNSEESFGEVDENEDEEDEMKSKIKLVPDNPECLSEIYGAFTRVQPLHNSVDRDSDEENDDFYYDENDEFEDYDEDDNEQILMN